MTASVVAARLSEVPRVELCPSPSPVEPWHRLAQHWCDGSRILVKRDDLVGVGMGGNKSRQLEYLLGDARSLECDVVVHGGAVQSNYCRQLAAACAILGLECHLMLSTAYGQPQDQGSHLLSRLFGAHVTLVDCPLGQEHERRKAQLSADLADSGRRPYLITYPRSETLGSLGYIRAALELREQLDDLRPDLIITPAVGATYAGLLLGLRLLGLNTPVIGFAPLTGEYDIVAALGAAIRSAAAVMSLSDLLSQDLVDRCIADIDVRFSEVGAGYAVPTPAALAALYDVARYEGVLLDPVYTGKAAAGLRKLLRPGQTVLFLHTGGAPAIFAYAGQLAQFMERSDA